MLFVRKTTPTVIVEDNSAVRTEAALLADERERASGTVMFLGVTAVLVLLFLVGYFAWWAPVHSAEAAAEAARENNVSVTTERIIERPVPTQTQPPTIIQSPPQIIQSPPIIQDRIVPVPIPVPTPNNNGNTGTATTAGDTSTAGG